MKAFLSWLAALGLLVLPGTGCAVNRSVVAVPVKQVAESTKGPVVVITRVTDLRRFEVAPEEPATPSLKDGAITDQAIKSRAFARKRGGFGKAMGDVLLPEGSTVEGLVKASLANALREAGYRVQEPGPGTPPDALKLDVDIRRFWCWLVPGFWFITTNFQGSLDLRGPIFKNGDHEVVEVQTDKGHQMVTDSDWGKTAELGAETLATKVREALKTP